MLNIQTISIIVMLLFLTLQAFIFGKDDTFSLILWLLGSFMMFITIFKLQTHNRKTFRIFTNEGGFLYRFFSNERSVFVSFISILMSLFFAFVMLIILKGVVHNHGLLQFFTLLGLSSFITYIMILRFDKPAKVTMVQKQLQNDIAVHALTLLQILFIALILNFIIVIVLSFFDTYRFLHSDVTINNFDMIANQNSIEKTQNNHYSRIFINAFILIDYFKLSAAKLIIEPLMQNITSSKYIGFYIIVFFFNFVKYFAFSFGFVLLQKGVQRVFIKLLLLTKQKKEKA